MRADDGDEIRPCGLSLVVALEQQPQDSDPVILLSVRDHEVGAALVPVTSSELRAWATRLLEAADIAEAG